MAVHSYKGFEPIIAALADLGKKLVAWSNDNDARKLYSKAEYKTEADSRAHDFLNEVLCAEYPGIPVISEEDSVHSHKRPEKYWLIDPIDGTASWYEGFKGFVTQAAYIENRIPLFGAVHSPMLGCTWTAIRGAGAKLNGNPLARLIPSKRLILTDNTSEPHGIARQIMERVSATGYLESGSLGLKSVLVADGTADLFVKRVTVRDWDIAPAAAILGEVNGCMALPSGEPFVFDGDFTKTEGIIVARDIALLEDVVREINEIGRKP